MDIKDFNIQQIINDRLVELQETGVLEGKIRDAVDELIQKSIINSLTDYDTRNKIQKKLAESISKSLEVFDFSTYHESVVKIVTDVVRSHSTGDVVDKIKAVVEEQLLFNRTEVKMSELLDNINKTYSRFEQDCKAKVSERRYSQRDVSFANNGEFGSSCNSCDLGFIDESRRGDDKEGVQVITKLRIDNISYNDGIVVKRNLNNAEKLLVQVFYNRTPIVMDVPFEEIEGWLEDAGYQED